MAVEDDTLKTLLRIEKLLGNSSQTTGFGGATTTSGGRAGNAQARRVQSQARGDQKIYQATTKSLGALGDRADEVSRRFGKLSKTIYATQGNFIALNKSMRVFSRAGTGPQFNSGGSRASGGTYQASAGNQAAQLGPANRSITSFTKGLSVAKTGLIDFAVQLSSAIKPLYRDFFSLQAIGVSASSSLLGLYGDAIKAGMGLEEYTKTLQENGPAVVRAGSFDQFGKSLDTTRDGLNRLGVFGADATKLSAALANSATTLGVPQSQLADATSRQVNVFEELRKTSMITADQFAELNKQLADNEQVQAELLGLSGSERSARMQELQRTNAIGVQLGLTTDASRKLGQALIDQRKLTTVQRFQAAGSVRQAGAILGMGAGDTEELSGLARKKNRTASEQARFVELGGRMQQRLEQFQNSEDPNRQFIADQLSERLGPIANQLQAAGEARLASESGPIINKDIGQNTGEMAQSLKRIENWLTALGKNPIYTAMTAALGSAAFTLALGAGMRGAIGPLTGAVMKSVGLRGAVGAAAAAGGPGMLSSLWQGTKNLGARGLQMFGLGPQIAGPNVPKPSLGYRVGNAAGRAAGTVANVGSDLLSGAKSLLPKIFVGIFKRLPLISLIVDAVTEVFTGTVSSAFSPDANWVERLYNAAWAGLTGIFGGVVSLVDSIGEFFGLPENFFRNKFDIFTSWVRAAFFQMLANLAKAVTLGNDNPVSKYFQEGADNAYKVVDELVKDSTATVNTIGAKNQKMLQEQKKTADEALGSTSKVINSTAGLAALGVATAQGVAVATPGMTSRASVTQPDVNTPANQATTTTNAGATSGTTNRTGAPPQTVEEILNDKASQIIALLKEMLGVEKAQQIAAEALQRLATKTPFSDTERNANNLLGAD